MKTIHAILNSDRVKAFFIGFLFALGFAPYHLFFIGFLVFPALIYMLDKCNSPRDAFFIGWWFGLGQFLFGLYWIGYSFAAQGDFPAFLGAIAVLALSAILAIYPAVCFAVCQHFWSKNVTRIFIFAAVWSLGEYLRAILFTGFPWNLTAHVWTEVPAIIQSVSLIGSFGLTLLSVLLFSTPILWAAQIQRASAHGIFTAILAIFFLFFFWGAYRVQMNETKYHDRVALRIVQANIAQKDKWVRSNWDKNVLRYIELSNSDKLPNLSSGRQQVIIWPETAIPYFLEQTEDLPEILAQRLGSDSLLISGTPRVEQRDGERYFYNSVAALNSQGLVEGRYDKRHLVPFGEYLPMRTFLAALGFEKLVAGASDFSVGREQTIITTSGIPPFSALICYEIIFPRRVLHEDGAEWIVNVTNDAWFGNSAGPFQHLAISQVRAIEMGIPVIRAAGTGISAVIDPYGRILDAVALEEAGVIDSLLPQRLSAPTLYDRFGELIFFLFIIIVLALSLRLNSTDARK